MYNSDQTKYLWCDYNDTEDYQAFRNINFISFINASPLPGNIDKNENNFPDHGIRFIWN